MADKFIVNEFDKSITHKLVDMGDGTYAETVVVAGGSGGSTDVSDLNKEETQLLIKAVAEAVKTDVAAIKSASGFYSTGYTLGALGDIASESESNGTVTRTRTWTYVTNPDGSVVASASAWSIA